MPLLNKKPFQKNVIPPGLKDSDKVFYCDVTNEVFENYQEFAERIILCNSLVWACEETGKSGLTYSEAVECEKNAKKLLHKFPTELRRLILFLVTLTNRSALSDLTDEIFYYVRERFFIGECLEYNIQGDQWVRCRVQKVLSPTSKDLSEAKNGVKPSDKLFWPPGSTYHYDIDLLTKPDGVKQATHVSAAKLRRKKSTYTRDRNHLYIKHFVSKVDGIWQLKPNVMKRYDVLRVKFEDYFVGQPPKFPKSESPKKPGAKKSLASTPTATPKSANKSTSSTSKAKKQESIDKYLKPKVVDGSSPGKRGGGITDSKSKKLNNSNSNSKKAAEKRKNTEEILERELIEKRRKMMEHQQQLIEKKQQKQLDSQRKKDEKKKLEEFVKEWSKTREDLELEDLRELPNPIPILLNTPNEYFGEIIMLHEFFQSFSQEVNIKNFFPVGITIELIDRAISQEEIAGPLCDFIHLLLVTVFKLQEEEEEEIGESYDSFTITNFDAPSTADCQSSLSDVSEAAINWPIAFHGLPLPKFAVDATTITEILRLHLLSAGGRVNETCSRWRAQEKGGFTANDDPTVIFRQENEHIIRLLSEHHVGTLSHKDKIAILECLVHQILMYMGLRNLIFESVETYRLKRVELRVALAAEIRKEKELMVQKKKKPSASSGDKHTTVNGVTKHSEETSAADQAPVNLEAIEKSFKEVQRKKDDLQKQLDELMYENLKMQLAPLGTDRAYRRFWVFPSLPGVFVEDDEQNPPPCLPRGTPALNTALLKEKEPLSYLKKLFQKEYNKENLGTWLSFGSPKKAASGSEAKSEDTSRAPLTCWGDNELCPVHSKRSVQVRWSYYRTESELTALLNSLNTRGKRESKLKALLTQHRETIIRNLSKQRINLNKSIPLDADEKDAGVVIETRKSSRGNPTYEDAMFNYPEEQNVEEVLETLLRNTILSIEERSNIGGLGALKVFNREAWIEAIKNNTYEKSCDKLVWGPKDEVEEDVVEKDPKAVPKVKVYTNLEKFEVLNKYTEEQKQNVKDMACALLQLEQSIEAHYLKPPLGAERTRHHPSKASTTDLLKRWEASLMKCTSFAQLFIHSNTLENSIAWSRSAQNAYCRICRRRGDAQNMLLCDSCNKGHHMYCLKPKLTKVPKGDWFCHACKPPVREPREVRERKKVSYLIDSDEELFDRKSNIMCLEKMEPKDKGKCKMCNERGNTIGCSKCQKRYHLNCLLPPLRKPPTMSWACHSCRHISAKKDEESAFMLNGHRRRTRHSLESEYSTQLPLDNATLQELLTKIMHHEDAWPFLKPVSKYEAADYLQIVKRPMDFATIRHKLNMLQYHMNNQVISDSMLVFQNCFLYNKDTSEIYQAGVRLLEYFKELCHELNFKKEFLECESQLGKPNADGNAVRSSFTNGELGIDEPTKEQDEEDGEEEEDEEETDEEEVDDEEEEINEQRGEDDKELIEVFGDEEEEEEEETVESVGMDDDEEMDSADEMEDLNVSEDDSSDDYRPTKKMRTS